MMPLCNMWQLRVTHDIDCRHHIWHHLALPRDRDWCCHGQTTPTDVAVWLRLTSSGETWYRMKLPFDTWRGLTFPCVMWHSLTSSSGIWHRLTSPCDMTWLDFVTFHVTSHDVVMLHMLLSLYLHFHFRLSQVACNTICDVILSFKQRSLGSHTVLLWVGCI